MLVLTRKKAEVVLIGPDVVVTVRDFRDDDVRLEMQVPAGMVLTGPKGRIEVVQADVLAAPAGSTVAKGLVDVREGGGIRIGETISITVLRLIGNTDGFPYRVRLGFEAPADVKIVRQEVSTTGPAEDQLPAPDDIP